MKDLQEGSSQSRSRLCYVLNIACMSCVKVRATDSNLSMLRQSSCLSRWLFELQVQVLLVLAGFVLLRPVFSPDVQGSLLLGVPSRSSGVAAEALCSSLRVQSLPLYSSALLRGSSHQTSYSMLRQLGAFLLLSEGPRPDWWPTEGVAVSTRLLMPVLRDPKIAWLKKALGKVKVIAIAIVPAGADVHRC